jgi:regulator of nucleoside diphosphate kinase
VLTLTAADFANLSLLESAALQRLLQRARIVPSDAMPPHVVTMYSLVICIDAETRERGVRRLVYPADPPADEADVSVLAPLGMALLGAAAGQEIQVELENGALRRLQIGEVLYQPEHDLGSRLIVNSRRTLR